MCTEVSKKHCQRADLIEYIYYDVEMNEMNVILW